MGAVAKRRKPEAVAEFGCITKQLLAEPFHGVTTDLVSQGSLYYGSKARIKDAYLHRRSWTDYTQNTISHIEFCTASLFSCKLVADISQLKTFSVVRVKGVYNSALLYFLLFSAMLVPVSTPTYVRTYVQKCLYRIVSHRIVWQLFWRMKMEERRQKRVNGCVYVCYVCYGWMDACGGW